MGRFIRWFLSATALALLLVFSSPVRGEQISFRFVPVDSCGSTRQVINGPQGAAGERLVGFGLVPQPFPGLPRPTHMVTFRHPHTGRNVTVPLTLPQGTPRLEYRTDSILYNYGTYIVEARFLPDGSVTTIYNSGFLRPLSFQ